MERMPRYLHGPIQVPELHQVSEELQVPREEVLQDILVVRQAVQRCKILLLTAPALDQSSSKRVTS